MLKGILTTHGSRLNAIRVFFSGYLISLFITACSLSLDLSPQGLGGTEQTAGDLNSAGEDSPTLAGDDVSGGQSSMTTGGMSSGGSIDRIENIRSRLDDLEVSANVQSSGGQMMLGQFGQSPDLPAYAGAFGDQSGEMAGDSAGTTPTEVIESPIQSVLPEVDCVVYDVINDRCIQRLLQSKDDMCADWQASYQMLRPLPWTGDRSTCQVGTYNPQGYDDFEQLLNVYRRHLRLDEVDVTTSPIVKECALAHDIVDRDSLPTFDSEASCYSEVREQAFNIDNRLTLTGNWSLYASLQSILGLTQFGQPLANVLPFRQSILSPRLNRIVVAGRARTVCLQTEEAIPSVALPKVLTLPVAGENPYAIIKDGNHNGRVPWSVVITEGQVIDPNITLYKRNADEFEQLDSTFDSTPVNVGGVGFSIVPDEAPQAGLLYRIDVLWTSESGMHHYQIYTMMQLCGLTSPDECSPTLDNCSLSGSHCTLLNIGTSQERWGCIWDGPTPLGGNCDSIGSLGCVAGVCVSFNNEPNVCAQICDTSATDVDAFSCSALCPNGFAEQGSYGLCP
jgi:hypothetical protein